MIELPETLRLLEGIESLEGRRITYTTLMDLSDIVEVSEEWDLLLSRSSCDRAFSSSRWFIATCRHDASVSPYVILARRGATLAGVLPLVLTQGGDAAAFPNYLTDYSDIIALQDDATVITGLLSYALSRSGGYKKIILSNIRLDSNCLAAVNALKLEQETGQLYRQSNTCYYIHLPASYDDYLKTRGSRFRKRLKRIQNIAHKNNLVVRELAPESFASGSLPEAFLSLHLTRHGERSCFKPARAQSFVEEILPALFLARRIKVLALFDGEKMIGIDVYTMGAASLCAWNGGFLSEAESCSPGKLLINAGVKLACDLKLTEYDFMRGLEDYKASWVNGSRPIGRLEIPVG